MSENKGVGIPRGLFFYRYRPFIMAFADSIDVDVKMSTKTNRKIINAMENGCRNRSCTAGKIFDGHCTLLEEKGYKVFVPKILKTKFGSETCAYAALEKADEQVFFQDELWKTVREKGGSKRCFDKALENGIHAQRYTLRGYDDKGYKYKALLAGRPYNIYDDYFNMDMVERLRSADIGIVTYERLNMHNSQKIDGIIYVTCLGCQSDQGWVSYLKGRYVGLPLITIEIGEHAYMASLDSQIEAFKMIIEGRGRRAL